MVGVTVEIIVDIAEAVAVGSIVIVAPTVGEVVVSMGTPVGDKVSPVLHPTTKLMLTMRMNKKQPYLYSFGKNENWFILKSLVALQDGVEFSVALPLGSTLFRSATNILFLLLISKTLTDYC